ncbi:hypothetical protein CH373_13605 [Leptospira perolatii]|uniref:Uncharacterized protein n=1 Tax=Leptospira perolatii TaxID=2023191 RepID=A0A2M9ZK68_9LEPT|nr:hypothetical protein [Leptospira perolatii]PJZ69317.1 hypothetical protein CH360_11170 [Leptospira perolatii]PJZ72452.1 hypothetical protein CH373_13605 [Leptospira perolatii]
MHKAALLLFGIFFFFQCSSWEKKTESSIPTVPAPNRDQLPILVQLQDLNDQYIGNFTSTFYSGEEGKDRKVEKEYAKFPILVGPGGKGTELELEGRFQQRVSLLTSYTKNLYLKVEGNKVTHNCTLGVEAAKEDRSLRKPFRSVMVYFKETENFDATGMTLTYTVGVATRLFYPIFVTGFLFRKYDCGLILEG